MKKRQKGPDQGREAWRTFQALAGRRDFAEEIRRHYLEKIPDHMDEMPGGTFVLYLHCHMRGGLTLMHYACQKPGFRGRLRCDRVHPFDQHWKLDRQLVGHRLLHLAHPEGYWRWSLKDDRLLAGWEDDEETSR